MLNLALMLPGLCLKTCWWTWLSLVLMISYASAVDIVNEDDGIGTSYNTGLTLALPPYLQNWYIIPGERPWEPPIISARCRSPDSSHSAPYLEHPLQQLCVAVQRGLQPFTSNGRTRRFDVHEWVVGFNSANRRSWRLQTPFVVDGIGQLGTWQLHRFQAAPGYIFTMLEMSPIWLPQRYRAARGNVLHAMEIQFEMVIPENGQGSSRAIAIHPSFISEPPHNELTPVHHDEEGEPIGHIAGIWRYLVNQADRLSGHYTTRVNVYRASDLSEILGHGGQVLRYTQPAFRWALVAWEQGPLFDHFLPGPRRGNRLPGSRAGPSHRPRDANVSEKDAPTN